MRRGKREKLPIAEWDKLSERDKKEEILKETQKEKSKRKSNSWREWRPPSHSFQ